MNFPAELPAVEPVANPRAYWIQVAERLARPVLTHMAQGQLKAALPPRPNPPGPGREAFAPLEALGRLLAGIAPWLETGEAPELARLARESIAAAVHPDSPDHCLFSTGQALVDTAFLAQACLRAPAALWENLDPDTQRRLVEAVKSSRAIKPPPCNWLLFSATVETFLFAAGEADWDRMRIDYALRQHEQWYLGDGIYGDGAAFHADYYNSFVILPMLVDTIRRVAAQEDWRSLEAPILARARRGAGLLERLISPEGTFPPLGRSLAYRFGAFQLLSQMALLHELPEEIRPAQVREALTRVIRRQTEAPGTFDVNGWLTVGFCGHQPAVGEAYISSGSPYLCSAGLLALGLPESDPFWSDPPVAWTGLRAWTGEEFPIDHAIAN